MNNQDFLYLSRRGFVKTFALMAAYSQLGFHRWTQTVLADVQALAVSDVGLFRLNLTDYAALKADSGSVRLAVAGMPSSFSQIIVSRAAGPVFYAVTSLCTHQGCTVNAFSSSANALVCPCHGSQYKPDGTVLKGPATKALTQYATHFDGANVVTVEIPGLGYSVQGAVVQAAKAPRYALTFPTVSGLNYEIRFRSALAAGSWSQVPFSVTADGTASSTIFAGRGTSATVYMDRTVDIGFYAVVRY
jgi:nitrite reductase/ring-hydroxylating ferredoxin subunit